LDSSRCLSALMAGTVAHIPVTPFGPRGKNDPTCARLEWTHTKNTILPQGKKGGERYHPRRRACGLLLHHPRRQARKALSLREKHPACRLGTTTQVLARARFARGLAPPARTHVCSRAKSAIHLGVVLGHFLASKVWSLLARAEETPGHTSINAGPTNRGPSVRRFQRGTFRKLALRPQASGMQTGPTQVALSSHKESLLILDRVFPSDMETQPPPFPIHQICSRCGLAR